MAEEHSSALFQDGTLSFLPTRLNRQPVAIGGLTADEMWITVLTSGAVGFFLGIPSALVAGNAACIPLGALLVGALGLGIGSRVLRRMKRGRPDTWFYRQVELALSLRFPAFGNRRLVTRSGAWTSRRTEFP
ncbi:TIGR03750 family conjugal transfer protein [Pseudomonas aeruginosa]|uniref:TIGR03750 family conjugal transfer protein n=1 Tax=Pseudomonas aeruginosa TaxID=287 RepID=UPI000F522687|nr:TIGR03750 family conjugal transfer protein [Pseudomonas aeruginosa]MCO2075335.1 TIGR03750 family conjugal transfer protein [Pseudomonas aeruginosa]RQF50357.1 TIGR03750 family conjugal transfer protein [Pseudomonas aeruginosa]